MNETNIESNRDRSAEYFDWQRTEERMACLAENERNGNELADYWLSNMSIDGKTGYLSFRDIRGGIDQIGIACYWRYDFDAVCRAVDVLESAGWEIRPQYAGVLLNGLKLTGKGDKKFHFICNKENLERSWVIRQKLEMSLPLLIAIAIVAILALLIG